jgi:hypothetical protein
VHAGSLSGSLMEACLVFARPAPKQHWGAGPANIAYVADDPVHEKAQSFCRDFQVFELLSALNGSHCLN